MATIVTRAGKASPLTNQELDSNFNNLNTDKAELSGAVFTGAITTNSTIDGRDVAADGVTADAALPKAGGAMTGNLNLGDNVKATFGNSDDLQIYHATNTYLENYTGNLNITNNSNDKNIQLSTDDGSGGVTSYILVNGNAGTVNLSYYGAQKLITNSGGITVTGAVTATSLDISGDIDVDGTTNLDVVDIDGAVDMASTLGVTGVLTANAGVVVDNITIDANQIDVSSGNFVLDVAGEIELDADGGKWIFLDGGTQVGRIENSSSDFVIKSSVNDKDIKFNGEDGNSNITALTLDMSAGGTAIFNDNVGIGQAPTAFSNWRVLEIKGGSAGAMINYENSSSARVAALAYDEASTLFRMQTMIDADITFEPNNAVALTLDGSQNAQFAGVVTANAGVVVDNITIDGNEIDVGSGDLTLDVAGNIILDADGGYVLLKDAGVQYGGFYTSSSDLVMQSYVQDKDIIFYGNDGGSGITALSLDMSAAGAATFNNSVLLSGTGGLTTTGGNNLTISGTVADHAGLVFATHSILPAEVGAIASGNIIDLGQNGNEFKSLYLNTSIINDSGFTIDSGGDIILDADAGGVYFKDGGTEIGLLANTGTNFVLMSRVADKDIIFKGKDGSSTITALTLDMSAAGAATFNTTIRANTSIGIGMAPTEILDITSASGDARIRIDAPSGSDTEIKFYNAGVSQFTIGHDDGTDNFVIGTTNVDAPLVSVSKAGVATFVDDVVADAFLPTTSGAYGSNHVGVHSSGVVLNAATGQTGYIMTAGSAAMTFAPTGATIQLGGLGAANKLDDVESGNWTPVFNNFSATGTTTNAGLYFKVGKLVYVELNLDLSSPSYTGSGSGTYITGLPFAVSGQLVASLGASTLLNTAIFMDNNGGGGNVFFKNSIFTIGGQATVSFMNNSGRLRFSATYYSTA